MNSNTYIFFKNLVKKTALFELMEYELMDYELMDYKAR